MMKTERDLNDPSIEKSKNPLFKPVLKDRSYLKQEQSNSKSNHQSVASPLKSQPSADKSNSNNEIFKQAIISPKSDGTDRVIGGITDSSVIEINSMKQKQDTFRGPAFRSMDKDLRNEKSIIERGSYAFQTKTLYGSNQDTPDTTPRDATLAQKTLRSSINQPSMATKKQN